MNLKYPKQLIQEKRVKQIGENIYEVSEYTVTFKAKTGRNITTCSCKNHTLYNNSNAMCSHILAVILFEGTQNIYLGIDKLISDYNNYKELKLKPSADCFIDDLNSLRRLT